MADVEGVQVVISEPDNGVRVDNVTGTIEQDQPDGGVVVHLDAHRPKKDNDGEDKFYRNLASDFDLLRLGQIANELHEQISADDQSRKNHLDIRARGLDLLGLELKEPRANVGDSSASVEGLSTVTNPLLLDAVLKGWANSQAELLPAEGPVKVADEADPQTPVDTDLADALSRDMNHYMTVTAREYYPDTSHMLLWGTYFGGSGFKKVYRCPLRRRPVSESVDEKDLIVSDTSKDFSACARITHQIPMRPSLLRRMIKSGVYHVQQAIPTQAENSPQVGPVEAKIGAIQGTDPAHGRPEDQPFTIWETQCELDLPEYAPTAFKDSGIPLPYLVTMDKDSRAIYAIRRDWDEDDAENAERDQRFVRYPYVPGPGFYGTGLLNILGNASAAMTAAWRLALDNGMFANFPSGLADKSLTRQNTANFRLELGALAPVDTGGKDIRSLVMPTPYRDITAGFLALMDKITQQAQSLGGSADIPTAEGVANVPVGTMLAQIEQATKVMAAAHKGMHTAQADEIRLLVKLFRKNPEDFWRANKVCPRDFWNEQKFEAAINACNLIPASDPNTPSHIHRVALALALIQLTMNPVVAPRLNVDAILNTAFRALKLDPSQYVLPPPQPSTAPDPNTIAAAAKLMSAQAAQQNANTKAGEAQTDAQVKTAELSTERDIATTNLAKEMVIHQSDSAQANKDHALGVAAHNLNVGEAVHDAQLGVAQHALDVHQALNPPQPDSGTQP